MGEFLSAEMGKDDDEVVVILTRKLFSERLARFLDRYSSISPNQISVFGFFLVLLGSFFLLKGGYENQLIGSGLALIYLILDCADGVLARIKGMETVLGKWLDTILGLISIPLLMFSLAYGMGTELSITLGAIAMVAYPLQYSIVRFYKLDIAKSKERLSKRVPSRLGLVRYVRGVYGSSLFFPVLFFGVLINKPMYVLLFFAILGNLFWMMMLLLQYAKIRAE